MASSGGGAGGASMATEAFNAGVQLWSSMIGAGANLLGTSWTNSANAKQAALNRQFQREERNLQNQWNLDMWNMSNEYNDAESQMERMIAAGINPSAAAQGISGAPIASGVSQGSTPGAGAQATMQNPLSTLSDVLVNSVNSIWQTEALKANVAKTEAEAEGQEIANDIAGIDKDIKDATWVDEVRQREAEADKAIAEAKLSSHNEEILRSTKTTIVSMKKEELKVLKEEVKIAQQNLTNMKAELEKLKAEKNKINSDINVNTAAIGKMEQETTNLQVDEQIKQLEKEIQQVIRNSYIKLGVDPNMSELEKGYIAEDDALQVLYGASQVIDKAATITGAVANVYGAGAIGKAAQTAAKYAPKGAVQNANPNMGVITGQQSAAEKIAEKVAEKAAKKAAQKVKKNGY